MKRIIPSLALVTLMTTITPPAQAWTWSNGWNQVTDSGSAYAALAGLAAASAGVWYLKKNGYKVKEERIDHDLTIIEQIASNPSHGTAYTTAVVQNHRLTPRGVFGHDMSTVTTTAVEDERSRRARNRTAVINSLSQLRNNLTADEYATLKRVKDAHEQAVTHHARETDQADALGNLTREMNTLRERYPTNTLQAGLAAIGVLGGTAAVLYTIADFITGARR